MANKAADCPIPKMDNVDIDARAIINLHYLQNMAVGIRRGLKKCNKIVAN
jgi:hypothetical protein